MEKAAGNELGDLWYTMAERQRLKMIFEIVKLEALLFSIQLPGYGSIYYEHDLPPSMRRIGLQQAGGNGKFCEPPGLFKVARPFSPEKECFLSRPILRHADLQPNNILVSVPFEVVSLIDWQHCSILPLFLQAGPPKYFQNYGDAVSEDLIKPQLPSDFDQLGENEQEAARIDFQQRQLHYYYFAATAKFNDDHFSACTVDEVVLKPQLFQHAGDPWEGDSVTLKADLIRVVQNWERLYASTVSVCPLHYSPEEIDECLRLEEEQRLADDDMEKSRNCLGVSGDGGVPTESGGVGKRDADASIDDLVDVEKRQSWPGVPDYNIQMCRDANVGRTVTVRKTSVNSLRVENVAPECMVLATLFAERGTPIPCGSACLDYVNLSAADKQRLMDIVNNLL
ncbi:hypothetical protein ALT_8132 [Aspergillus lentulus]|uniref:Aminoglycoside phosphotransferase domain-containing protein n=1 Tax=Aspergillus lentulus TaxID=293939 RepID=A0AAN4PRF4_ASPLE|nr:hypothetical protein ALT_8132 [Aspergillus lentulus]